MTDPLAEALALLRSHAEVCSRYGCPDQLRAEADRIEALAGVAAGPQTTPTVPSGWHYRYLIASGGDDVQLWAIDTHGGSRHREIPCLIRGRDLPDADDVRVVAAPTSQEDQP